MDSHEVRGQMFREGVLKKPKNQVTLRCGYCMEEGCGMTCPDAIAALPKCFHCGLTFGWKGWRRLAKARDGYRDRDRDGLFHKGKVKMICHQNTGCGEITTFALTHEGEWKT